MRNWIKVERAKKNITQEELAKALEMSKFSIVAVETGRYEPSCEMAMRIAEYFGKKVEEVFFLRDEDIPR